jgi:hypothetical protein
MIRRHVIVILAISLILITAVFNGGSVKAESVYDGAYKTVEELYLSSSYKNMSENVSLNWSQLILDDNGLGNGFTPQWAGGFSQQQVADLRQSFNNTIADPDGGWTVSQITLQNGDEGIIISWSQQSGFQVEWSVLGTKTSVNNDYALLIAPWDGMNNKYAIYPVSGGINATISGTNNWWSVANVSTKSFIANLHPNYPADYEGELLQTGFEPAGEKTELKPDYAWKVDTDGKLNIQYLDNIKPSLTGFVYPVIEKMTTDWGGLDINIQANEGWRIQGFNQSFTLPSAGYYMFSMDYDQTFDSPPWQPNADRNYEVAQIWIQFYWDGSSVITGNSSQCKAGEICNKDKAPPGEFFLGLNIDTKGLTGVLLAPIRFVSAMDPTECQPINAELIGKPVNLPCLTPLYMASIAPLVLLWQTIITGVVGYLVGINIFNRLKKTVSPQDDSIEVMKL